MVCQPTALQEPPIAGGGALAGRLHAEPEQRGGRGVNARRGGAVS